MNNDFECINTIRSQSNLTNGGFTITKQAEPATCDPSFTCPNPSCGRYFSKPLKAINLRSEKAEPYLACPYCLTEITAERPSPKVEAQIGQEEEARTGAEETAHPGEEEISKPQPRGQCAYHFGYLHERSRKEPIPEECIVCEDILSCMRKPAKD